jgi:hypothetical protein
MTTSADESSLHVPNMTVSEMHRAIVEDFEVAWAALAKHGSGGGNFMFASTISPSSQAHAAHRESSFSPTTLPW